VSRTTSNVLTGLAVTILAIAAAGGLFIAANTENLTIIKLSHPGTGAVFVGYKSERYRMRRLFNYYWGFPKLEGHGIAVINGEQNVFGYFTRGMYQYEDMDAWPDFPRDE
jgi:hypothetical protein